MKLVKSLMLGSAAGLVVMSGAQAADLPVKAKAVEYVKICSLYGAGFYYIPGTDTCIKLGGYLRAEIVGNSNNDYGGSYNGQGGANNRFTNGFTWRARQDLSVDTRTATEYGVVRTFSEFTLSWTDDSFAIPAGETRGNTLYSSIAGTAGANSNNASSGNVAGGTLGVYYAYIQFAGFTIGKAISEFSTNWQNYPANNFDGLVGGGGAVTGVNQFTYTWQLGNGVSAAFSIQDPTAYFQAGVANLGALSGVGVPTGVNGAFGTSDYAGTMAPDFIGTFTIDQAWGYFKFSVAAHDNHAAYYLATEPSGHPSDRWGGAGQAGFTIKNIPTGPGDTFNFQAVYTDGATRYNIQDLSPLNSVTVYGGSNFAYQSVALAAAPDTVFINGGQQQLTQTWGLRGGYNHNWDPYWSSGIYGAYAQVMFNSTAKTEICGAFIGAFGQLSANGAAVGANVTTCNPNYNIGQLGFITRWTPVKNLTFSADAVWTNIDIKSIGTVAAPSAAVGKPVALYELKDQNTWTFLLRAQRNF